MAGKFGQMCHLPGCNNLDRISEFKVSLKHFIAVKLSLGLCFHDCKHEVITSMLLHSCDCPKKKLSVITQIEIQDSDLCLTLLNSQSSWPHLPRALTHLSGIQTVVLLLYFLEAQTVKECKLP